MSTDTPQPAASAPLIAPQGSPFRTRAAIIAAEALVLTTLFGTTIVSIPLRLLDYEGAHLWKLVLFFSMIGGILWTHFLGHKADYIAATPRSTLLLNAGVFLLLVAYLIGIASGAMAGLLGERVALIILLGLLAVWLATVIVLWVPAAGFIPTIVGRIGFAFAVLLLARFIGFFTSLYWRVTSEPTMRLVELCLTPFAGDIVKRPEPYVIGTQAFSVKIFDSCSGHAGIGLITALLAGYLWWFRDIHRFPQSLLLFPVGVVLSYLANVVRITALILVGIWISPAIADGGFHSQAGWIMFLLVGLGIICAAQAIPFFTLQPRASDSSPATGALATPSADGATGAAAAISTRPSATACLLPFLALTAVTILTGAFTSGFDRLYPIRVITVAATLFLLRGHFSPAPLPGAIVSPGAIGIGACVFAMWMALAPGAEAATEEKLLAMDPTNLGEPWTTLWLLVRVVGSVITVPIAEELAFRGFLIRRCIAEDVDTVPVGTFTWLSFLASSLAFGILHGGAWIAGTVAGMAFAAALYQRRRIFDAVAAHATTNALLSIYVIGTGSWTQWG